LHTHTQVIHPPLLREGFELVLREGLEVTDDVSIIEALGKPVRITSGSYTNIKVRAWGAGCIGCMRAQLSWQSELRGSWCGMQGLSL